MKLKTLGSQYFCHTTRRDFLASCGALSSSLFAPRYGRAKTSLQSDLKFVTGQIGDVKIARVQETVTYLPVKTWFPDLKIEDLAPYLSWLSPVYYEPATGLFPLPMQTWILSSEDKIIVVDTGYGNNKDRPGFGEADQLKTAYLHRLETVGVRPEQVDYVLCTHLHLDHTGWNTRLENGRWVPTFPNAKYIWSYADQQNSLEIANDVSQHPFTRPVYRDSVLPVIEAGLSYPIKGLYKLSDQILLRPAPGHSPGTLRIEVKSKGQTAVFCGDMLHSPLQIPLWPIGSAGDYDRAMAAEARRALLDFCVDENALLIAGHFPAPHVARVERSGDSFVPRFGWHG